MLGKCFGRCSANIVAKSSNANDWALASSAGRFRPPPPRPRPRPLFVVVPVGLVLAVPTSRVGKSLPLGFNGAQFAARAMSNQIESALVVNISSSNLVVHSCTVPFLDDDVIVGSLSRPKTDRATARVVSSESNSRSRAATVCEYE